MNGARRPGLRSERLTLPEGNHGLGRGSRSPSPLARPGTASFFGPAHPSDISSNPEMATSDAETIRSLTEALQGLRATSKKPSLPAFDSKHIDIWIKRVESAYIRSSVVLPKEKFAFLEEKIGVDVDPKINEFLFGSHTEQSWTDFLAYLRRRYGKTQQQKAQAILNGPRRDGKRPSELLAHIKERVDDVSLDEVLKEMVVRELPTEIQRAMAKQTIDLTADETAQYADSFFDASGRPTHSSGGPGVNAIDTDDGPPGLIDTEDESEPVNVNAVGGRFRQQRRGNSSSNFTRPFGSASSSSSRRPPYGKPPPPQAAPFKRPAAQEKVPKKLAAVCEFHAAFGDRARQCQPGCEYKKTALNTNAGRRA